MKIRNGFVSNSSSSSFCIFGIKLNENENLYNYFNFITYDTCKPKTLKCNNCYSKNCFEAEYYYFDEYDLEYHDYVDEENPKTCFIGINLEVAIEENKSVDLFIQETKDKIKSLSKISILDSKFHFYCGTKSS